MLALGLTEGDSEGLALGLRLGLFDGDTLGDLDGLAEADGLWLGETLATAPIVTWMLILFIPRTSTQEPSLSAATSSNRTAYIPMFCFAKVETVTLILCYLL